MLFAKEIVGAVLRYVMGGSRSNDHFLESMPASSRMDTKSLVAVLTLSALANFLSLSENTTFAAASEFTQPVYLFDAAIAARKKSMLFVFPIGCMLHTPMEISTLDN